MPSETRSRNFKQDYAASEESEDGGKTWSTFGAKQTGSIVGSQITDSEGHARLPNGNWDGGGPFYTCTLKRSFPTRHVEITASSDSKRLCRLDVGTPFPDTVIPEKWKNIDSNKFRSKDTSDLDKYGADAIALTSPTNPNANLGVALAEMHREGIPTLPGIQTWRRRTELLKAAGSEFLNAEFGWLPLISDIKDTSSSVRNASTILKQYSRDKGRNVRREFAFPVEESTSSRSLGSFSASRTMTGSGPGLKSFWASTFGPAELTQSETIRTKRWFSGAFTYDLPDRDDTWSAMHRNAADADKLFGITDLTPEILWELTPWSWAADWFTNVSSVIHNVNNFALQGLIMRYGFMMEEHSVIITNTFTSKGSSPSLNLRTIPGSKMELISKVRRRANPFGFGVTTSSLSPTQVAIAVALGITLL